VCLGLIVVVFAGILAWQTMAIPSSPLYARVGPTLFPWVVVTLLAGLGVALAVQGLRGGWAHDEELGDLDFAGGAWMLAGLAANVLFIGGMDLSFTAFGTTVPLVVPQLGFILASTIQFVLTARAFESRKPLRDVSIGFALATVAYVGFDQLLGYRIGTGIVEQWIQAAAAALGRGG
jgi:putative tricarboxylic transport membrane protein